MRVKISLYKLIFYLYYFLIKYKFLKLYLSNMILAEFDSINSKLSIKQIHIEKYVRDSSGINKR